MFASIVQVTFGKMEHLLSGNSNTKTETDQRTPRRRMLKKAIASYSDGAIWMEVIVRDLSKTGARLKLKENDILPDHFNLFIELDGIRVDCEAVWRHGLEIGVRFASDVVIKTPLRSQYVTPTNTGRKTTLRRKPISP